VQKIVKAKNDITNNVTFKIVYDSQKFEYSLPTAYNNYYIPAKKEDNQTNGTYGRLSLYLYKIGNDETDKIMITNMKGFDSILYVRPEICLDFVAYTDVGTPVHNHTWTNEDEKARYIANFRNIIDALNRKYYIETENNTDFQKTYIHFIPHYNFGASANPVGHRTDPVFQVHLKAHNTVAGRPDIIYAPDFFKDNFTSNDFSVDMAHNLINTFRYILGLSVYELPSPEGNFNIDNMAQAILDDLDALKINDLLSAKFVGENALHKIPAPDVTVVDSGCKWTIIDKKTNVGIYQETKYAVERLKSKISVSKTSTSGNTTFDLGEVGQTNINSLNSLNVTLAMKNLFKAKSSELASPVVTLTKKNSKWKITDTGNVEYNPEIPCRLGKNKTRWVR
jgi:hypothetical protein